MNLERLGWNDFFLNQWNQRLGQHSVASEPTAALIPARVAREDRTGYVVYAAQGALRATLRGTLRYSTAREHWPAVGDWVAVRSREGSSVATIHFVLPRRTTVRRISAGETGAGQIVAANVDVLLICCGLDSDFNPRRIERYLTLAYVGGVVPVIALTKTDLCDDGDERRAAVESIAPGCAVLLVSGRTGAGLDAIRSAIPPCGTVALVGSSGVGKSTIINAILDENRMMTREVRQHDSRGQHTTTQRQLLLAPGGGVVIDTPGMRELFLAADDDAINSSFSDIDSLAMNCRFRDCRHASEPGCAVRRAAEAGGLDSARLDNWHKQRRERDYFERRDDKRAQADEKARWKAIHKAAQKHYQEKYRMD